MTVAKFEKDTNLNAPSGQIYTVQQLQARGLEGIKGEGGLVCGSKPSTPPLCVVFLPTSFGQAKEVGPRREGNFSAEDDCRQERRPGVSERIVSVPYEHN